MEEVSPTTDSDGQACDEVVRTLATQRAQVRNFVAAHQRRLRQAETELAKQLAQIGEELARDQHRTAQGQAQAANAQSRVTEGRAELDREREQLEASRTRLRQEERELDRLRRELAENAEELTRQRQRLQEKLAEVEGTGEALAAERQATTIQRRRIAQELKAQNTARLKELERRRDELKLADENLKRQLDELGQQQTALGDARTLAAELDSWRRQSADLERQLAERSQAVASAERRLQASASQVESLQRGLAEALAAAAAERESFKSRLSGALEAASQATANPQNGDDLADMKRRYDMALDDLREQRQRTAELEQKLAEIPKGSTAAAAAGEGMDWEAQKRRMLAAWEANVQDDGDDQRREERLKIQEVIAKTDAAMTQKEQELDDLRSRLADASENQGAMAASAAASDELLSQDETIRAGRARLQQLQLEWEEKLRRAEVELSVERAKMARQRADIEERQRQLQELRAESAGEPADAPVKEKKPQRGRWLTRLGLKEDESE